MSNQKHFIVTSDNDTAKKLQQEGFVLIEQTGKFWKFLNDWSKSNFSESIDQRKIGYTNQINI